MKRDLGHIRLGVGASNAEQWQRFNGAIETASRLGYSVTLRITNDPHRTDVRVPLDIVAEVDTTERAE